MNGSSSRSTGDDKSYALLEHDHSSATLRTSMFGDDVLYVAKDPATEKQSKILLLKCLYFLAGIGGSTWGRFATIFYMSKGLSPAQIGIIEGAMPATKAICQPVWGILSDKMNNKKQVFLLTKILSTVFLMSFAIPGVADSFLHILLISIAISSCVASGVLDAYCLDTCGKDGKKLYGRIRLWTAVSWGVGCFVMGYVNDYGGFEYNFALYFLFSVMLIWLVWIKVPTFTKEELKNKRQEAMLQARDRERRGGKKSLTVSLDDQLLSFVNEEEKREGLAWQKEAGIGGAPGDNYSDDGSEYHHSHHGPANHDYSNAANALYSHHHSSGADVDAADADDDAVEVDELVDGQRLSLTQVLCRPAPLYFFLEVRNDIGLCYW